MSGRELAKFINLDLSNVQIEDNMDVSKDQVDCLNAALKYYPGADFENTDRKVMTKTSPNGTKVHVVRESSIKVVRRK